MWSVDSLPSIGTVCEVNPNNSGWRKAKISYIGNKFIAWFQIGDEEMPEMGECTEFVKFRESKTKEQRELHDREKAIREMGVIVLSTDPFTVLEGVAALYDSGYRKQ